MRLCIQVCELIAEHREELLERRYSFPIGKLLGVVRETLKWADGKLVKSITEQQVKGNFFFIEEDKLTGLNVSFKNKV